MIYLSLLLTNLHHRVYTRRCVVSLAPARRFSYRTKKRDLGSESVANNTWWREDPHARAKPHESGAIEVREMFTFAHA